jgi:hypothetical protein
VYLNYGHTKTALTKSSRNTSFKKTKNADRMFGGLAVFSNHTKDP